MRDLENTRNIKQEEDASSASGVQPILLTEVLVPGVVPASAAQHKSAGLRPGLPPSALPLEPETAAASAADSSAVHTLDAVPGGDALTNDPFHVGRLHMLQREEAIYLSSHMIRDSMREEEASSDASRRKSDTEIAEEKERLLQRQREEAGLYRSLFAVCTVINEQGACPAPCPAVREAKEAAPGSVIVPGCLPPGELEPHLAAYSDFILLGGPLRRSGNSGLFAPEEGFPQSTRTIYKADADTVPGETGREDDPAWIHVNVPDEQSSTQEDSIFPRRPTREGRLSKRSRSKGKDSKTKTANARQQVSGFGRFLVKLVRLIIVGGLVGFGYLLLTRYGLG